MKKTTKLLSAVLAFLVAASAFSISAGAKTKKYVKSLSVKKSASITIPYGKKTASKTFKVTVKVSGKASKKFTAKSSKKSVATVRVSKTKIKVTAKKAGSAVITVKTNAKGKNGKVLSKKLKITVTKAKKPAKRYEAGLYKVGTNLKPGVYVAYPYKCLSGYYCVSSDEKGKEIIANNNFYNQNYVEVKKDQYLELNRCYMISAAEATPFKPSGKKLPSGQYLVGFDLPAGEYKLTPTDKELSAITAITDDANGKEHHSGKVFKRNSYVNLKNGQYFEMEYCVLNLDKTNFEKDYAKDVQDNLALIKEYIMENGEEDEDGNKYIFSESSPFITKIIYISKEEKLSFVESESDEFGTFDLKIGEKNETAPFTYVSTGYSRKGTVKADLKLASYEKDAPADFSIESSEDTPEETLLKMAQSYLNLVTISSKSMLYHNFNMSLNDIGFRSYN